MDKLLTQQDLAERWQVDVSTITNWRKEGVLTQCKGIPAIRFNEQYILELEGVRLEKISPLMYKKLEKEYGRLEEENKKLKAVITNVLVEVTPALNHITD
jgi:predicted site-specific integrase-resolvase